jgi:hypothetical protein
MGFLSSLFGGDDSSSKTTSTSNATNTAYETDRRAVASDQAVSLTGDNNTIDRSTSSLTQFFDTSNRSTNFSSVADSGNTVNSNNTTTFTDNSDRSVRTTVTDYGSVNAGAALANAMGTKAIDLAGGGLAGVFDMLKAQTETNQKQAAMAFDLAKSSAANAMQNSAQAIGFADSTVKQTQDNQATSQDGGQSKMVTYGIMAAAAVGIAFAFKR